MILGIRPRPPEHLIIALANDSLCIREIIYAYLASKITFVKGFYRSGRLIYSQVSKEIFKLHNI